MRSHQPSEPVHHLFINIFSPTLWWRQNVTLTPSNVDTQWCVTYISCKLQFHQHANESADISYPISPVMNVVWIPTRPKRTFILIGLHTIEAHACTNGKAENIFTWFWWRTYLCWRQAGQKPCGRCLWGQQCQPCQLHTNNCITGLHDGSVR